MTEQKTLPVKLFLFRLWVDDKETTVSFTHTDNWNRAILILPIQRLYPEAKKFKLTDGVSTFEWDNTEKDALEIIDRLNHPEKYK